MTLLTTEGPADFDDCQNPLYPRDAALTEDEKSAMARDCSMMRALSPGEIVCIIDQAETEHDDPITHVHDFQECMDWRHAHVIGDDDPWTYWLTYDEWADIAPPLPPLPPPPPVVVGWNARARTNPMGVSYMDGIMAPPVPPQPNWANLTVCTTVDAAHVHPLLILGGTSTRVRLSGNFTTLEAYIGPLQAPWIALELYRLTFGGSFAGTCDATGNLISDPLSFGFDGSHGFMLAMFLTAGSPAGKTFEPGWGISYAGGNLASMLNKDPTIVNSPWHVLSGGGSAALLMVEGYYGP